MTVEQLKDILRRYGWKPNKTYGQNFLLDEFILEDMVDFAHVSKNDAVLEIGPGIGNLTERLLKRAQFVMAVEKDPKFLPVLKGLAKRYKNFRYEIEDILEFDFQKVLGHTQPYRVVANIPYYITGKIVQLFLQAKYKPTSVTVLVQKEVAQNMTAEAGDLNLLAISVQLYSNPKLVQVVSARKFFPAPKVDSAIVHLEIPTTPRFKVADEKKLFRVLRACFTGKRKQIHNTLVNNLHLEKTYVAEVLTELQIDSTWRPQQLTIPQWLKLTEKLKLP
jgi:16S rRNA (adenine1518-N6/adenine1519-N6)-dimethyltransferase